jgi:hypothetical protein
MISPNELGSISPNKFINQSGYFHAASKRDVPAAQRRRPQPGHAVDRVGMACSPSGMFEPICDISTFTYIIINRLGYNRLVIFHAWIIWAIQAVSNHEGKN